MKVRSHIVSIDVTTEEWKDIYKDFQKLQMAEKPKQFIYKDYPFLHDFLTCIDLVSKNLNHTIDKEVNKY